MGVAVLGNNILFDKPLVMKLYSLHLVIRSITA